MPKPAAQTNRILIIPDKFKGTLTAAQAAAAIARGWLRARPQDPIRQLPMTDGGDGFGDCMRRVLGAKRHNTRTLNAAHQPCITPWWLTPDRRTAIVESALCVGLAMLPPESRRPFHLDTKGLAPVILAAARAGATTCLVGIGGSATNDGGFGLALGLGWRFLRRNGSAIKHWTDLHQLHRIEPPTQPIWRQMRIIVATDVQNPLLGHLGATRVYGPQKGLRTSQFHRAERNLLQLSRITSHFLDRDLSEEPGAGAAGGLGFGLLAFAQASLKGGLDLYARQVKLAEHLRWADCVVTAEGALDASTLMGKGVGEIAARAKRHKIPCLALAGQAADLDTLRHRFDLVRALSPDFVNLNQALTRPGFHLGRLSRQVAASFFVQPGRPLK